MLMQRSLSLDGYEIVFICDDSSSMNTKLSELLCHLFVLFDSFNLFPEFEMMLPVHLTIH